MINLEDEVREGFFVPTMMKRNWACQLDLLEQIDRICTAHQICYYPGFGTLLGAVRHRGFVPWDDDIDLLMTRNELERFLAVAKQELPAPLRVCHTGEYEYTDREVTKITGEAKIILETDYLRDHYGFPYPYVIDLFILDGICEDREKESEKRKRLLEIEKAVFQETDPDRRFELVTERNTLYHSCPAEEAEQLAIYMMEGFAFEFQRKWFDDVVFMPFEHLELPVPAGYRNILNVFYIDYTVKLRAVSSHVYPCYAEREVQLREVIHKNPFRYTFCPEDVSEHHAPDRQIRVAEMRTAMQKASGMAEQLIAFGDENSAYRILQSSIKLADALEAELSRPAEVLFLPLRASWWQSMEGLFRKIKNLGKVHVHVMPVPWQKINPDMTAEGKWYSDANSFSGIPELMEEGTYDFQSRQPDLIVVQFPYDGWNSATAIPTRYHVSELRKTAGRILYIPPYRTDDPSPDDKTLAANLRTLVEQPAVVLSDYVMLPSKEMRSFYMETLCAIAGEETRDIWSRRLILSPDQLIRELSVFE